MEHLQDRTQIGLSICLQAGFYFRNPVFQEFVHTQWSDYRSGGNAQFPPHYRMLLGADVINFLASCPDGDALLTQPAALACVPGKSGAQGHFSSEQHTTVKTGREGEVHGSECTSGQGVAYGRGPPEAGLGKDPAAGQRVGSAGVDDSGQVAEVRLQNGGLRDSSEARPCRTGVPGSECLQDAFDAAARLKWTQKALQVRAQDIKTPFACVYGWLRLPCCAM